MKLNNWMSEIDGKRDLLTLSIPGTHDCVTKFVQFEHISKTQDLTIAEQLNLGIRALDIRVESRGEALKMVHAFAKAFPTANKFGKQMDLDFVLNQCYDFLLENPGEEQPLPMTICCSHGCLCAAPLYPSGSSSDNVTRLFTGKKL